MLRIIHNCDSSPGYQRFVNVMCDMTGDERKVSYVGCENELLSVRMNYCLDM